MYFLNPKKFRTFVIHKNHIAMLRLNARFEIKPEADRDIVLALGKDLVRHSRRDAGNIDYDLVVSTTNPRQMMFVETWDTPENLHAHSISSHFSRLVPMIEEMTVDGLHLDKFEF